MTASSLVRSLERLEPPLLVVALHAFLDVETQRTAQQGKSHEVQLRPGAAHDTRREVWRWNNQKSVFIFNFHMGNSTDDVFLFKSINNLWFLVIDKNNLYVGTTAPPRPNPMNEAMPSTRTNKHPRPHRVPRHPLTSQP